MELEPKKNERHIWSRYEEVWLSNGRRDDGVVVFCRSFWVLEGVSPSPYLSCLGYEASAVVAVVSVVVGTVAVGVVAGRGAIAGPDLG